MRAAAALCLLAVLAALLAPASASADTLTNLQSKIGQAQQALKDLASRRQGQQSVVEDFRQVTSGYQAELRRVDQELLGAVNKLREAEDALVRVDAERQALEGEIAEKETAVEQRAAVYGTRLRGLYKFTRTSPLEQLLAARDFSDALRRIAMIQAVTRVDNRLLGQLRAEYDELMKAREALKSMRAEAVALRDEIDRQRDVLVSRRNEQAVLVARAQSEQRQAEAVLSEWDQQARAEQQKIMALQTQYQRELEEIERQRLEALRRQEEQRRLEAQRQAQATATAQAAAAARATAAAQAAQSRAAAPGAGGGRTAVAPPPVVTVPTVVPLPGSIQTSGVAPSSYGFVWPVANPVVTTEFGERTFAQSFHTGIDLAQKLYTPITAAGDGIVLKRGLAVPGKPSQSYGMMVVVGHSPTVSTLYAHLDDRAYLPTVKEGDRVKRGQIIGYIGMTGITSGPHLHFEVFVSGGVKNPRQYLPK